MTETASKLVKSRKRRVIEALDEFGQIKDYLARGHKHLDGTAMTTLNGQCQGIAKILAMSYAGLRFASLADLKEFTEILATTYESHRTAEAVHQMELAVTGDYA